MQYIERGPGPDGVDVRLKLDQGDKLITVYGLFDVHSDNAACDMPLFKRTVKMIADDPTARVVIGGDFNDMMFAKFDPRMQLHYYCPDILRAVVDSLEQDAPETYVYDFIIRRNLELLTPIKDKIDLYISGNHEQKYYERHGSNIARDTAALLGVPFYPYDAGMRYFIGAYAAGDARGKVVISEGHVYHGHGGGEITGGTIDLYRAMKVWPNKWIMRGDNHASSEADQIAMNYYGAFGNLKYRADNMASVNVPSFLRGYVPGKSSFARSKHMSPKALGASCVYLCVEYREDGLRIQSSNKPGIPRG